MVASTSKSCRLYSGKGKHIKNALAQTVPSQTPAPCETVGTPIRAGLSQDVPSLVRQRTAFSHAGPRQTPPTASTNKRRRSSSTVDYDEKISNAMEAMAEYLKGQSQPSNDPDRTFVDYVLATLNQMPAFKKRNAKREILSILESYEDSD